MKQSKLFFRVMSVLLTLCLFITAVVPQSVIMASANAYPDNYDNLTNEQKQAVIEQRLKEVNAKLSTLGKESKETEEYIDTLDQKIGYLQNQLNLDKQKIIDSNNKITNLKQVYENNKTEIANLKVEIEELSKESVVIQKKFDVSYSEYSERAKAMYISGNMTVLEMLLTCDDISTLFTRLEMIKRVSKHDRELLNSLKEEGQRLLDSREKLQQKNDKLEQDQTVLIETQETLTQTVKELETQQLDFTQKQKDYETEKKESDELLVKLHQQKGEYSELRNQEQAELDAINADIAAAADRYIKEQEKNTTTTTTTKKTTTTTKPNGDTDKPTSKPSTQKPTEKPTSSNRLSLTYPVPSQTRITCDYGEYKGHTGVDFSCASNSKVVAAESGTVIISTDLKNSDGSYRSYGRYIVIAHNKKDAKGNYVFTLYAHNSQRLVSEGDYVKKGQQIAKSGSTGNSTGPHCHFEVRTPTGNYNDCVNPRPYLP